MNKTIIFLIRHSEQLKIKGEYVSTESEQVKNEKIVLSARGEELAQKLSMCKEFDGVKYLFSSNYVRAIATAKYISDRYNICINIDEKLGERKLRRYRCT